MWRGNSPFFIARPRRTSSADSAIEESRIQKSKIMVVSVKGILVKKRVLARYALNF